jgi:hypothetical protein
MNVGFTEQWVHHLPCYATAANVPHLLMEMNLKVELYNLDNAAGIPLQMPYPSN